MLHSPDHSSRTSPSFTMSPPRPDDVEEDMQQELWQPLTVDNDPPRYGSGTSPRMQKSSLDHDSERAIPSPAPSQHSSCPPATGKIRNQLNARKTVQEALNDCGDNEDLRVAVRKCVECEEYKAGKAVPAELLNQLCEVVGTRSHSRCRFPSCGKLNVRTDRAKEHARVHIGNHPYPCTRIQADGTIGCGATFLRKHDRNRHDNGADVLKCEDCGANIQGKGREYNLHRHKMNYCPVRKAVARQQHDTPTAASPAGYANDPTQAVQNQLAQGTHTSILTPQQQQQHSRPSKTSPLPMVKGVKPSA